MPPYGLLNLNKPAGPTSRQVVNTVQRVVRRVKIGHAGTLDPLATGVLVVCLGPATRLIEYLQRMPKCYTGEFLLGRHSPSEDMEGEVTELQSPAVPTREEIAAAAKRLVGRIQQRPPAFSALKVKGRRAYKLARRGEHVELKPRPVTVHRLEVLEYEYPRLSLAVECGSGTYIRSLGRDLAESLGTASVMSALERTSIGPFSVREAIPPQELKAANLRDHLLPALRAVYSLPRVELSAQELVAVRRGREIPREAPAGAEEYAATDASGRLVAILVPRGPGLLGPSRNFPAED